MYLKRYSELVYVTNDENCLIEVEMLTGKMQMIEGVCPSREFILIGSQIHYFNFDTKRAESINISQLKSRDISRSISTEYLRQQIRKRQTCLNALDDKKIKILENIKLLAELLQLAKTGEPVVTISVGEKISNLFILTVNLQKNTSVFARAQKLGLNLAVTVSSQGLFRTKIVPIKTPMHIPIVNDVKNVSSLEIIFTNNNFSVPLSLPFRIK